MIEFITNFQNRKFAEDVEFIESKEGEAWIEKGLCTDFKNGLTGADLSERAAHFGSNRKVPPPQRTYCEIVAEALGDFTLRILIVAAIISIILNMIIEEDHRETAWIEGFAILVAVGLASNVQAFNDYQKEK